MTRVVNFSAGPAMLPAEVLARAGDEMLDWRGSGMGVMEMSHRGKEFMAIAADAESDLRELLAAPAHYKLLFLQGGATLQFAQVPMNLLRGRTDADYVLTGEWSKKAVKEAKRHTSWIAADEEYEQALLTKYYQFKGWNSEGIPTRETLEKLGLGYVADDLEQRGILTVDDDASARKPSAEAATI